MDHERERDRGEKERQRERERERAPELDPVGLEAGGDLDERVLVEQTPLAPRHLDHETPPTVKLSLSRSDTHTHTHTHIHTLENSRWRQIGSSQGQNLARPGPFAPTYSRETPTLLVQ